MTARLSALALAAALALLAPSSQAAAGPAPLGCENPPAAEDDIAQPLNLDLVKRRVVRYRCTAYDRDVAAVLADAQAWVAQRAPEVARNGGKPAITLDIDETSLSNWTQIYRDKFAYLPAGPCDLDDDTALCGEQAWERSGRAPALAPTLALYRAARCLEVPPPCAPIDVFFITGRREKAAPADGDNRTPREWTKDNLRKAGYADVEDDRLILRGEHDDGVAAYKSGARARIESVYNVTIIANVGDQLSDLAGGRAERQFKVPNPFYFIP